MVPLLCYLACRNGHFECIKILLLKAGDRLDLNKAGRIVKDGNDMKEDVTPLFALLSNHRLPVSAIALMAAGAVVPKLNGKRSERLAWCRNLLLYPSPEIWRHFLSSIEPSTAILKLVSLILSRKFKILSVLW
jgi:hypothetical protein